MCYKQWLFKGEGELHSIEGAFSLDTQQPRVWFSAFTPKFFCCYWDLSMALVIGKWQRLDNIDWTQLLLSSQYYKNNYFFETADACLLVGHFSKLRQRDEKTWNNCFSNGRLKKAGSKSCCCDPMASCSGAGILAAATVEQLCLKVPQLWQFDPL